MLMLQLKNQWISECRRLMGDVGSVKGEEQTYLLRHVEVIDVAFTVTNHRLLCIRQHTDHHARDFKSLWERKTHHGSYVACIRVVDFDSNQFALLVFNTETFQAVSSDHSLGGCFIGCTLVSQLGSSS